MVGELLQRCGDATRGLAANRKAESGQSLGFVIDVSGLGVVGPESIGGSLMDRHCVADPSVSGLVCGHDVDR